MKFRKLKITGKKKQPKVEKHALYFEIVEACEGDKCPICYLVEQREMLRIKSIFYEHVNDVPMRAKLRKASGLCSAHVQLFLKYGDPLGLAVLANDIISQLTINSIQQAHLGICPLCLDKEKSEKNMTGAFNEYLALDEFWESMEKSAGLCLKHFYSIYQLISVRDVKLKLLNFEKKKFRNYQKDLASFIRKQNFTMPHSSLTENEIMSYQLVWKFLRLD